MSEWGGNPWGYGGGPAPQSPYDRGWSTHGAGPAPQGPYDPGWSPYDERPPHRRGSPQRRVAVGLGIASIVLGVVALAAFVVGLMTFWAGGFLLWMLTKPLGIGAMVLAVISLLVAGTARDSGWGSRFAAMVPGALTLLVTLPGLGSSPADDGEPARAYVEARLASATGPADVVDIAAGALTYDEPAGVCLLLARAARGPRCERDETLRAAQLEWSGRQEVVRESGTRALVRRSEPFASGPPQLIRVVREDGAWRLLDLPGFLDDCVDRAEDPFGCPVRRYGA